MSRFRDQESHVKRAEREAARVEEEYRAAHELEAASLAVERERRRMLAERHLQKKKRKAEVAKVVEARAKRRLSLTRKGIQSDFNAEQARGPSVPASVPLPPPRPPCRRCSV